MSLKIFPTDSFKAEAKRLAKKHKSFKSDYKKLLNALEENPMMGTEVAPNIRKIRMAITSKGRGKSGGARVITYDALVQEGDGVLYLVFIYDKSDAENIKINVIQEVVRELRGEE